MTRAEHMAWCKERALVYVARGDLDGALTSFASDIRKHPETSGPAITIPVAVEGMRCLIDRDLVGMRRFIEGFAA